MPQFLIRQQFTNEEVTALAPKIHSIIGTDSHLTVRSRPWIHKRLMNGECLVALDRSEIAGFLFGVNIGRRFIEINSWYVAPTYRGDELGDLLFSEICKNPRNIYFGNTYRKELVNYFKSKGFIESTPHILGLYFLHRYLFTRSTESIKNFLKKNEKVTFLVKYSS